VDGSKGAESNFWYLGWRTSLKTDLTQKPSNLDLNNDFKKRYEAYQL
jgi:hypothetical protein